VAFLAAAALALVPGAGAKGDELFAVVGDRIATQELVRLDPTTLAPLPGRVALEGHHTGSSLSPDGSTLVLGDVNESCVGGSTTLRFVDVRAMRTLDDVPLVKNGSVAATGWLDRTHVSAAIRAGDCISSTGTALVTVDASARRVVASTSLDGEIVAVARAPGRLVVLLAPKERIGVASLAVVDSRGAVRVAHLRELRAGQSAGGHGPPARINRPGLAVDRVGSRAFVVPAGDRLAEVDLATLAVRYRDLSERRSLFDRFRRWLDPSAAAKGSNGPIRQAMWVGDGLLAVTGVDTAASTDGRVSSTPAGLRLVDTRDWTYRRLADDVSAVRVAGGLLLATGSGYSYDGTESKETNAGFTVYGRDGRERYRLFDGASVQAVTVAGRVYLVTALGRSSRAYELSLASGKTGRELPAASVWHLVGTSLFD
jgi:hypothetical protein